MDLSQLSKRRRQVILGVTLAGVAATTFPITVLSAALPEIATDLDTTDSVTSWVIAGPLLAVAVATPIAGKLGDLYGHRRIYIGGFALSTAFSVLTALAWSVGSLIAFRMLSQTAAAATGPAGLAIIMQVFPRDQRAPAIGLWSAVSAASPTVGIVLGGPLVDLFSWRAIFVIQSSLAAFAIVAAILVLPSTARRESVRFDIPGAVTLGAGVAALLLVVSRGAVWGAGDPRILVGTLIGVALLVAFVAIERRAASPLVPFDWMRTRSYAIPVGSQFFTNGTYMGTFIITPIMLERLFGYSTSARALLMITRPISFSTASWVGGRQQRTLGTRRLAVFGAALIAAGSLLTGMAGATEAIGLVLVALAMAGWGNGYARPALLMSVANTVGDTDLGMAGASFNVVGQIGAAAWITVLTAVLGDSTEASRFVLVYAIGAAGALVGLAMVTQLGGRGHRSAATAPADPASTRPDSQR